jgi:PAS domain S-box-containing protein
VLSKIMSSSCIVLGLSTDGTVIMCNKFFLETTGFSREEVLNKQLSEVFAVPDQERLKQILGDTLSGQEKNNIELGMLCKNSRRLEISLSTAPVENSDGAVTGVFCFSSSTAEKQAKEDIKRTDEEYRALMDVADEAIFGVDHTGAVNEWNSKLAAITGFTSEVSA